MNEPPRSIIESIIVFINRTTIASIGSQPMGRSPRYGWAGPNISAGTILETDHGDFIEIRLRLLIDRFPE
jgi:hypothetical protein